MEANDSRALMRRFMYLSRRQFLLGEIRMSQMGLSPGQVPILMELSKWGDMPQRELSERVRVSPATMSAAIKRMCAAGLVVQKKLDGDARVAMIGLTESGLSMSERAKRVFDENNSIAIDALTDEQLSTLGSCFEIMLANVERAIVKFRGD